jgi:predicted alpha/beta superfamily hydrolase
VARLVWLALAAIVVHGCDRAEDPVGDDDIGDDDAADDDDTGDDDDSGDEDHALFLALLDALEGADSAEHKEALAEVFLLGVHYSGGFPIFGNGAMIIAAMPSPDPSGGIDVSGDFSGWEPDINPMNRDPDIPFYWLSIPHPGEPAAYKYKLVHHRGSGDDWQPDPWARRYGYDEYGEFSLAAPDSNASHLERYHRFAATGLGNERTVRLYMPAGYESMTDLPALYMHDGQNLFDPDAGFGEWEVDETLDELIGAATIAPVLVVGIDNTAARFEEYTHCADDFGHGVMGGDADLYASFVVDEVMPFVEARYPTGDRAGMLGSSLGGLVTLHIGWSHADLFEAIGGMSSTLGWGAFGDMGETQMELWADTPAPDLVVYLDSGGEVEGGCMDQDGDGIHEDSVDSDNYCVTLQMVSVLESKGFVHGDDLWHWWEMGAAHNESAWAERMPLFLESVFPGTP